ncbi:PilT protein domain protein [Desulfamplus magnetovallimortis]|uniref:Ribonuclease VapC n=1 Tax=Desulfamplus magnetovallimortis TaxID=1246637 RepID=A0A1W1HDV5_9BACT|nr:PIN domain nuclease [Desulfamplus magnetovallimortis]SLM30616.1 PilT protein domain protein [Desulfamplus magnetovallimortis]
MILVDTSVLIDWLKGKSNAPVECLKEIIQRDLPFGITSMIYQELLQGAKNDKEYELLKEYLSSQNFYHPLSPVFTYEEAARIYFLCRKKGVTIRSTVDCLIAQIAIEHNLFLLHNDRDFNLMAPVVGLKLLDVE